MNSEIAHSVLFNIQCYWWIISLAPRLRGLRISIAPPGGSGRSLTKIPDYSREVVSSS